MQARGITRQLASSVSKTAKLTTRPDLGMVERMVIDTFLINVALVAALMLRVFFLVSSHAESAVTYERAVQQSLSTYIVAAPILSLICIAVFFMSGFYTQGRAYKGRYKALIVFQAVTVAYGLFAVVRYLFFDAADWFPRSAWIIGYLLTLGLVGGVRVWAKLWRATMWTEARFVGSPKKKAIRNVLVIGGAGFVGSVLVRKLLNAGYNVTVMDAFVYGNDSLQEHYGKRGFSVIEGDLRDVEAVIRALQYSDAVVHLGGLVGDPACALDEKLTTEVNLASTRLIAEAARGFGVQRFIFASSCSVYGASDQLLNERSKLDPVSLYARTKVESEKVLLNLEDLDFAPIILRFGTFYGFSRRPRFDLVVNLLTAKAVSEKQITIMGGDQWRPFIHVEDGATSILKCLQAPLASVKGEIFNVGADKENYTIDQIGELVQKAVPDAEIVRGEQEGAAANYRVSFAKISKYIGFEPEYTVEDGVAEIKDALELGLIPQYKDAIYSNIRVLTERAGDVTLTRTEMSPLYNKVIDLTTQPATSGS
jgi:nucleoside-diphosphate-sugar epimerase